MRDDASGTLAIVLAGGEGSRLDVLTDRRAKPAMRVAGTYRLIDIPLSNCANSRIPDVWVVQQYEPHSLTDHLGNGRPWDLDRTWGGLKVMHPHTGTEGEGFHHGTGDAIAKLEPFLREQGPDRLVVLSSDHVYRMDYREVLAAHDERGSDVTIVTTTVPREEASRFGVVEVAGDRVTRFVRKPDDPPSTTVATEVYVFSIDALYDALAACDDGDDLDDLGDRLLPWLVEHGDVRTHPLSGYWRDVGTIPSYLQMHLDLLGSEPPLRAGERDLPWYGRPVLQPAAYVAPGATVEDALISPGAIVHGSVRRAVVGPGVTVAPGATVDTAVLLDGVHVGRDAAIRCGIVDEDARIGAGATVGADGDPADDDDITVIGRDVVIADGDHVPPGARLAPPER